MRTHVDTQFAVSDTDYVHVCDMCALASSSVCILLRIYPSETHDHVHISPSLSLYMCVCARNTSPDDDDTTCRVLDVSGTSLSDTFIDGFGGEKTVGEVLVAPTALYPRLVLEAKETLPGEGILGMAHITGGGFTENIPRILPAGLGAAITLGSWDMLPIFPWLQQVRVSHAPSFSCHIMTTCCHFSCMTCVRNVT